jgi:hypothetical protein
MFHVHFNRGKKDLSALDIHPGKQLTVEDLDDELCRGTFTNQEIILSFNQAEFTLYHTTGDKVTGIACITMYGNMWEITHICVAAQERGLGSRIITKLKEIAGTYPPPLTLYGLGLYPGSVQLYLKNGFVENRFEIGKTRKGKRKVKRKRRTRNVRKFMFVVKKCSQVSRSLKAKCKKRKE